MRGVVISAGGENADHWHQSTHMLLRTDIDRDRINSEARHRMQSTEIVQVSPEAQLAFYPALEPCKDLLSIFSLRMWPAL